MSTLESHFEKWCKGCKGRQKVQNGHVPRIWTIGESAMHTLKTCTFSQCTNPIPPRLDNSTSIYYSHPQLRRLFCLNTERSSLQKVLQVWVKTMRCRHMVRIFDSFRPSYTTKKKILQVITFRHTDKIQIHARKVQATINHKYFSLYRFGSSRYYRMYFRNISWNVPFRNSITLQEVSS